MQRLRFYTLTGQRVFIAIVFLLFLTVHSSARSPGARDEKLSDVKCTAILKQVDARIIADELSRLYKTSINFEKSGRDTTEAAAKPPIPSEGDPLWKVKKVDFEIRNMPLEKALDAFVAMDNRHVWEYDSERNVVHVRPPTGSVLQWTVEGSGINGGRVASIFFGKQDPLGFRKHGCTLLLPKTGNHGWLDGKVTITNMNLSAEKALDEICEQLPFQARWEMRKFREWHFIEITRVR